VDQDLQQQITELRREVENLKSRRITQVEILPDVVKMRHVGEGVRFIQTGLASKRPTTPAKPPNSAMLWFATDTGVLSIWNISTNAWVAI